MLLFLVISLRAFLPAAALAGLLVALLQPADGRKAVRRLAGTLACGLAGGGLLFLASRHWGAVTAARVFLEAAEIFAAILLAGTLFPSGGQGVLRRGAALVLAALTSAVAAFSFSGRCAEQALSAVSVLNTDMLLNVGGIFIGLLLAASFIPLVARLAEGSGRRTLSLFILASCVLLVVPWTAEALLGLMRLEKLQLTSTRLSFAAKVTHHAFVFPYAHLLLVAALALLFFSGRRALSPTEPPDLAKAARRKALGRTRQEGRWFRSALASIVIVLTVFLQHDLYASRPPRISKPVFLTPDAGGRIRVRIDDVMDGKLHRYAYVTEDGHVVRFFLINRAAGGAGGRKKIGVVYDACMLCGDMGYLQDKSDVVCIACNVRIFIPSIGKPGGCNPIPLRYEIEGESVAIAAEELDKGAQYFSHVIDLKVKDPVTGKEMISRRAPRRHEYMGRTYFFESEESLERFLASPDAYAGRRLPRYSRAQGAPQ